MAEDDEQKIATDSLIPGIKYKWRKSSNHFIHSELIARQEYLLAFHKAFNSIELPYKFA